MKDNQIENCKAYAAFLKDDMALKGSTSGGLFYAFARRTIEDGGVCYGATIDETFDIHHIRISSISEIDLIRRSKYAQSRIGNSFSLVKEDLEAGRRVLFSGTPCQIAGLKSFLKKEYINLRTVDLFCHGVPSNRLFKEHIGYLQHKFGRELVEYQFRNKDFGWLPVQVSYLFAGENDREYYGTDEDAYFNVFDKYVSLRKSCYSCCFRKMESGADVTIGDYWGIQKEHPDFTNDNKGISAIIIKTEKGLQMWQEICDSLIFRETDVKKIGNYNWLIFRSIGTRVVRDAFFEEYTSYRKENEIIDINRIYSSIMSHSKKDELDVYGSYALRACVYPILVYDYRIAQKRHLTGTTIVSSMSEPLGDDYTQNITLENEYRRNCLFLDWSKSLLKTISSDAHGSMLIMDLLEEAQDILVLENGKMITATEALEDYLAINELNISRRISIEEIDSEIWERLCDKLIDTIRHTYRFENTCVVRNYLSLRHGNSESVKFFQNIDVLNRKNLVLKNRYDYLISHMPGCKEVNYSSEDIYTPDDYVYGCKPNYYSPDAYRKVAHEIYRVIGEKEWK